MGTQPYSSTHTARDSWFMALLTFGEGYHNYHHEFQHDYRNGVKPWQFDPTKWAAWTLSKIGLTSDLRRVPDEKIELAEIRQKDKQLAEQLPIRPSQSVRRRRLSSPRPGISFILQSNHGNAPKTNIPGPLRKKSVSLRNIMLNTVTALTKP